MRFFRLIATAFTEQIRAERAYLGNFWLGILTKLAYNITFILFIDQLYHRIGQLGDFTKNEFLFVYLVSQLGFYLCYMGIFYPLKKLILTVRTGNFDLLLLKPVPHRAFVYISGMAVLDLLITALPSFLIVGSLIDWGQIDVTPLSVILGLAVWVSGIVICNTFLFALTLPVFKKGESSDLLDVFYSVSSTGQQPYSKLTDAMKLAALIVFPQIIIAGAASEVLLMQGDMVTIPLIAVTAAVISVVTLQFMWRYALRNYTSASS